MKIMVVGGGGREHAIIKKLKENKEVTEIFALPGNGGMAKDATLVDIGAKDIPAIVDFAKEKAIDLAVIAPDDPLVLGAVDELENAGIPCFGYFYSRIGRICSLYYNLKYPPRRQGITIKQKGTGCRQADR